MQFKITYTQYGMSDNFAATRGNMDRKTKVMEANSAEEAIAALCVHGQQFGAVTTVYDVEPVEELVA